MKILTTIHPFTPEAQACLEQAGEVTGAAKLSQAEFVEILPDYEAVLVGLGLVLDKAAIDAGKNLKYIATATTGLDHIDVAYAKAKGIEVLSLRGEEDFLRTITGTAELAFGLLLALSRNIPSAYDDVKVGKWDREKFRGHSLSGKTLGLFGLGRLGSMMARYGVAFGMRVIAHDPQVAAQAFAEAGCGSVSFETVIAESDVISIHVHLSEETKSLFNEAVLQGMRSEAYLINTSRGEIVDEAAVLKALREKKIAGYAADVLANELNFPAGVIRDNDLVTYSKQHANCIIVPHIGGMTYESRKATDIFIAKKLISHILRTAKPRRAK
ncbi:hypothetical protein A2477_03710 [Candidatus Falkowbacteria bacterium RIFOXYC2_FULL_47_12]|uniref:Hydroxyacid dehydrogenase n=2 Tax=Candidatus Falkowiibacteriota TaxID=1752728 RepID=A0A1F5TP52_9BACT|nr:MAG: hypothetical protein A2242_03765 [Candidatus Falkowbacteria bacterium RIFOXYA2_FULL_47_9]OGF40584.1 MAG: hypothetical protein A2477_03710 [Candidatus Falkowbacteria bacterium RIFOXYC2_FULL_47_12]